MILNKSRNTAPRVSGGRAALITVATIVVASLVLLETPRLSIAQNAGDSAGTSVGQPPAVNPNRGPLPELGVETPQFTVPERRAGSGQVSATPSVLNTGAKPGSAPALQPAAVPPNGVVGIGSVGQPNPNRISSEGAAPAPSGNFFSGLKPAEQLDRQRLDPNLLNESALEGNFQPGQRRGRYESLERRLERLERLLEEADTKPKEKGLELPPAPSGFVPVASESSNNKPVGQFYPDANAPRKPALVEFSPSDLQQRRKSLTAQREALDEELRLIDRQLQKEAPPANRQ